MSLADRVRQGLGRHARPSVASDVTGRRIQPAAKGIKAVSSQQHDLPDDLPSLEFAMRLCAIAQRVGPRDLHLHYP